MPEWITVRTPLGGGRVATSRAPFDPVTTEALVRAARAIRHGPPLVPAKAHFSIYVVLLRFADEEYGLCVGRSGHTPDERYPKHKSGHKASKWVRDYGIGLLPALYRHLNPLDWDAAPRAEVELGEALGRTGIKVRQA